MDINFKSLLFENRTLRQTIFKNTFWLGIAEIFTKGTAFIIAIWLARHFGPSIYGQWAFALSFVTLFVVFSDFRFSILTTRELARDKSKTIQYIDNITAMKIILGLFVFGIIALIIQFLGKEQEIIKLVYFLAIYTILNTFVVFFQSIFRANEKMQYETASRGLQSLGLLLLVSLFILNEGSIITISYAHIGAALIGIGVSLGFIWRYFSKFFLKISFEICKEILKEAWPFALAGIMSMLYVHLASVILGIVRPIQEVGWYNAAYKPVQIFSIIPALAASSILPILSKTYKKDKKKFFLTVEKMSKLMKIIALPLSILIVISAKYIIKILYGDKYIPAVLALQILIWAVALTYLGFIYSTALNAANKQKIVMYAVATGGILNIILNLILILKFELGLYGAAIATLISQLFLVIYLIIYFKKILNPANL